MCGRKNLLAFSYLFSFSQLTAVSSLINDFCANFLTRATRRGSTHLLIKWRMASLSGTVLLRNIRRSPIHCRWEQGGRWWWRRRRRSGTADWVVAAAQVLEHLVEHKWVAQFYCARGFSHCVSACHSGGRRGIVLLILANCGGNSRGVESLSDEVWNFRNNIQNKSQSTYR